MQKLSCQHPVLIINPKLRSLIYNNYNLVITPKFNFVLSPTELNKILTSDKFYIPHVNVIKYYELKQGISLGSEFDKQLTVDAYYKLDDAIKKFYKVVYYDNPYKIVEQYHVCNQITGDVVELFMLVTCGKCDCCRMSKSVAWQNRILAESSTYDMAPFFVTLTFNDDVVKQFNLFQKFEQTAFIQKFLKRLRIRLHRDDYRTDFRYFLVSEHTPKHKRLHYHCLFFGIDKDLYNVTKNYWSDKQRYQYIYKFQDYVRMAWTHPVYEVEPTSKLYDKYKLSKLKQVWKPIGFASCELAKDPTGKYCMKYMSKQYNCNINLHSNGVGKFLIDQFKEQIINHPTSIDLTLRTKIGLKTIKLCKYIRQISFPSICEALPKEIRDRIINLAVLSERLQLYYKKVLCNDNRLFVENNFKSLNHSEVELFKQKYIEYEPFINDFNKRYKIILEALKFDDIDERLVVLLETIDFEGMLDDFKQELYELDVDTFEYDFYCIVENNEKREKNILATNMFFADVDNSTMHVYAREYFSSVLSKEWQD